MEVYLSIPLGGARGAHCNSYSSVDKAAMISSAARLVTGVCKLCKPNRYDWSKRNVLGCGGRRRYKLIVGAICV